MSSPEYTYNSRIITGYGTHNSNINTSLLNNSSHLTSHGLLNNGAGIVPKVLTR